MTAKTKTPARPLYEIASEIRKNWKFEISGTKCPRAAEEYIGPMSTLNSINDAYGMDSAREIVARFLCNASSWKGETAKRVKAELNAMLKR